MKKLKLKYNSKITDILFIIFTISFLHGILNLTEPEMYWKYLTAISASGMFIFLLVDWFEDGIKNRFISK